MSSAAVLERAAAAPGLKGENAPDPTSADTVAARRRARESQRAWARRPIAERTEVIRRARRLLATRCDELADAIASELPRSRADTVVAEVLPLLAACRYLEREAATILKTRVPARLARPLWLAGVHSEVERVPLGVVLVVAPSNYPLLLPGVQVLQALTAGNAAIWKPGRGGRAAALKVAQALQEAGLPEGLLRVTDESVEAVSEEMAAGPEGRAGVDKVVFTGSAAGGRAVLRLAAETMTPVVAELSGSDAVIALPGAPLEAIAEALAFGLRLNGSATCMAPRRLLLVNATEERRAALMELLLRRLADNQPVPALRTTELGELVREAIEGGATLIAGEMPREGERVRPLVLVGVRPEMRIAQTDVFAPVLSVIEVQDERGVLEAQAACPLALTAAVFGPESEARALAAELEVGTVLINDVIVATADPRVPFTGRRASGFGSTRGAEGLLEMTAPRVIAVQRGRGRRRFEPTGAVHFGLFAGLAAALYAGTLNERWRGARQMTAAAREIGKQG